MFTIKNKEEELASLKNQLDELRLQEKLGNQNFHEDLKKIYNSITDTFEDASRDITKTMMETTKQFQI